MGELMTIKIFEMHLTRSVVIISLYSIIPVIVIVTSIMWAVFDRSTGRRFFIESHKALTRLTVASL